MMRPALACLLLAGAAASPDCGPDLLFVRSFHPWSAVHEAHCQANYAGGWRLAGQDSSQAWYFYQPWRDSSLGSPCAYLVYLGDTALVRSLTLQPTSDALLRDDVRARDEVAMDSVAMATWEEDSTRFARISEDQSRESMLVALMDSIGGQLFLDLTPYPRDYDMTPFGLSLMMPANWVFRAEASGDSLRLFPLSRRWIDKLLDSLPATLANERESDLTLITAPTESLSHFVLHHARDTLAFPPRAWVTLTRMRP